jgi:transcriptional regulator with GAF, ATPase, and Fis domain
VTPAKTGWTDLADAASRKVSGLLSTGAIVLAAIGALLASFGQDRKNLADWAWVAVGTALVVAAGLLQVWLDTLRKRGEVREEEEATRFRVAIKDALQPLAILMAETADGSKKEREAALGQAAQQVVGALALLLKEVDRRRAVVYALDPAHRLMRSIAHAGRGAGPRDFVAGTPRGDTALQMLADGEPVLVADLAQWPKAWAAAGGEYSTFVAVPIVAGQVAFGMVTVDAPNAGDLTDTDMQLVVLFANLLAVVFVEADR